MKKLIFFFLCAFALFSCVNEDEVYPTPTADFTFPATIYAGEVVELTPVSGNGAMHCEWSLGGGVDVSDGYTANSIYRGPQVKFPKAGNYTVTLTTRSRDYGKNIGVKSNSITKTVTVKESLTKIVISKITVNSISFTTNSGSTWDSSTGPDLYLTIESGSKLLFKTGRKDDVLASQIPFDFINLNYTIVKSSYATFTINMWNWNGLFSDDKMVYFNIALSDIPYNATSHIASYGKYKITLYLTWQ